MDKTLCGNCGESISEPADTTAENSLPCPKCGSKARNFSVEIRESVVALDTVSATLITYPNALLTIAQSLIDQGYFNIAIITSHMACEVASERAFDAAYATKDLSVLGEAIDKFMNGKNLGNDRNRKLYNALTLIKIEQEPFWADFKSASEKRNSIIHKGGQASQVQAEVALKAATQLITYLKQI